VLSRLAALGRFTVGDAARRGLLGAAAGRAAQGAVGGADDALEALFKKALETRPRCAAAPPRRREPCVDGAGAGSRRAAKRDDKIADSRIAAFIAMRDMAPGDGSAVVAALFRREDRTPRS